MRGWWTALWLAGCGPVGDGDGVVTTEEVPQPGWTAELQGFFHDVSGTAVLVDDDTIELQDFTYDGGGINARLFLVVDGARFSPDLELTDNLVGTPFAGETLTLELPEPASAGTWDALTLWCLPAQAAFGLGVFSAP